MTSVVLDASALLSILLEEAGAEEVRSLGASWLMSAVNFSEVVAAAVDRGLAVESVMPALTRLAMDIVAFDAEQACLAASLRPLTRAAGLSLGDRACLALGLKTGLAVATADRAWAACDVGVRVIQIR